MKFKSIVLFLMFFSCSLHAQVQMPKLSQPWAESKRILGNGIPDPTIGSTNFFSDFCFIKDNQTPARWHSIGIYKYGLMDTMYHAVSDSLLGEWSFLSDVVSPDPIDRMWAPYAVWDSKKETAYLYYHHKCGLGTPEGEKNSMRLMVSGQDSLNDWVKYDGDALVDYPNFPGIKNIVFEGIFAPRDACMFFDEDLGKYIMYYADNNPHAVQARTSTDLLHWSESVVVMTTPEPISAYCCPESPFVIKRNGLYYLMVCGFDYSRMALYISQDPFNFGDPSLNKVGEINGHAPEVVVENGKYYIACAHIATIPNQEPGWADLWGTYIQELVWVDADNTVVEKIVKKKLKFDSNGDGIVDHEDLIAFSQDWLKCTSVECLNN